MNLSYNFDKKGYCMNNKSWIVITTLELKLTLKILYFQSIQNLQNLSLRVCLFFI